VSEVNYLLLLLQDAFATLVVTDLQGAPTHIPFELEPSSAAEKLRYEVPNYAVVCCCC
jgi:hypothetical protein